MNSQNSLINSTYENLKQLKKQKECLLNGQLNEFKLLQNVSSLGCVNEIQNNLCVTTSHPKRLDSYYNERQYSDVVLVLVEKNTSKSIKRFTSKAYLAQSSQYFKIFFLKHNNNKNNNDNENGEFLLELREGELDFMDEALRCTYLLHPVCPQEQLPLVLLISYRYELKPAVALISNLLLKLLKEPSLSFDYSCRILALEEMLQNEETNHSHPCGQSLPHSSLCTCSPRIRPSLLYDKLKSLIAACKDYVRSQFKSVNVIFYERKEDFLKLPLNAVIAVLDSTSLTVDSEGSLFYAIMRWSRVTNRPYDPPGTHRPHLLRQVWPYIRFYHMRDQFLLDVVPYIARELEDEILEEHYQLAIDAKIMGLPYMKKTHRLSVLHDGWEILHPCTGGGGGGIGSGTIREDDEPPLLETFLYSKRYFIISLRPALMSNRSFNFKCTYKFISKLTPSSRYYSSPVYAHGFEIYFFVRLQKLDVQLAPCEGGDDDKNYTLGGYLRCTSPFLPQRYYLPIKSTVTIMTERSEKRFVSSSVIFESDKAIGGKLTLSNENWELIKQQKCPIVIDDTLTAVVMVEFLDTDEGCQMIEEVLQ